MNSGQLVHASRSEEAKKFNGIYKLYYKDLKLYGGCAENISIWDFDIKLQKFQYRGDVPINNHFGPAIGFDSLNENLFCAQLGGNTTALRTVEGYPSCGSMPEPREV